MQPPNSAVSEAGVCEPTGTVPLPSSRSLLGFQKICPVRQLDTFAFLPGLVTIFLLMANTVTSYGIVFNLENN